MPSSFPPFGKNRNDLDVIHMFTTRAIDKPEKKVKLAPGTYYKNGKDLLEFTGGLSLVVNFPSIYPIWVLVGVDVNGIVKLIYGSESSSPIQPKIPENFLPSSYIYIKPSDTFISNDMIIDARGKFALGLRTTDHNNILNRGDPDAHTMDSITGLVDALDDKVDDTDLTVTIDNLSLIKANMTGTIEPVFILNEDATGTVTEISKIVVERGADSNVEFGFNPGETDPNKEWYFITKSGATMYFGVSTLDDALGAALIAANVIDAGSRTFSELFEEIVNTNIGLTDHEATVSNVDNTSDVNKPVSIAQQTALDLKTDLTLVSNVDNTSDADKPVSTDQQTALDLKANLTLVNNVDNTSDANKPVSTSQQTALDLKANLTLVSAVDNTSDADKPVSTDQQTALDLKADLTLVSNIDNTSDANKPVSTDQQTALDLKANLTLVSAVDNTSDANKPVSTDQQTALDLKADVVSVVTPGTASINASSGDGLLVDTAVTTTVVLPATPSDWDEVVIMDATLNFASVNLTVGRNGENINGSAADLTLAVNGTKATAIYSGDATHGWNIKVE